MSRLGKCLAIKLKKRHFILLHFRTSICHSLGKHTACWASLDSFVKSSALESMCSISWQFRNLIVAKFGRLLTIVGEKRVLSFGHLSKSIFLIKWRFKSFGGPSQINLISLRFIKWNPYKYEFKGFLSPLMLGSSSAWMRKMPSSLRSVSRSSLKLRAACKLTGRFLWHSCLKVVVMFQSIFFSCKEKQSVTVRFLHKFHVRK